MEQLQTSTSTACAAVLLDAWERGDFASLRGHLDSTLRSKPAADLPQLECERRELVTGIAESMRDALCVDAAGLTASCEMEISVQLLRHLVRRRTRT
jgi:hypothetical protein